MREGREGWGQAGDGWGFSDTWTVAASAQEQETDQRGNICRLAASCRASTCQDNTTSSAIRKTLQTTAERKTTHPIKMLQSSQPGSEQGFLHAGELCKTQDEDSVLNLLQTDDVLPSLKGAQQRGNCEGRLEFKSIFQKQESVWRVFMSPSASTNIKTNELRIPSAETQRVKYQQ